jgi:hypothetical protein
LKEYLVKGYAINEQRLKEQAEQFNSLKQTVSLLGNVLKAKELTSDEATGLLKVVTDYRYALEILDNIQLVINPHPFKMQNPHYER